MPPFVAIIGAGAAGLCAADHCVEAGYSVVVFEQTNQVGGTWVYDDNVNVHSSMYEKMHTNLPKEVMHFPGIPFPDGDRSFIEHPDVLNYLQEYSKKVEEFIEFSTKVVKVTRLEDIKKWKILTSTEDGSTKERQFDVVFVCNGHFFNPRIPEFSSKLTIPWIHSHDYRKASDFAGKKVVIVGCSASGADIGLQVGAVASKVSICHRNCATTTLQFPENFHIVAGLKDVEGKKLMLDDGSVINDADFVIFCTGYRYSFPFLDDSIIRLKADDSYVSPLFAHCIHTQFKDSLFFIGLNVYVVPFILFYYQVKLALAFAQGTAQVTDKELNSYEPEKIALLDELGLKARFHQLADQQWDLFEDLAKFAGIECTVPPVVRKMYDKCTFFRRNDISSYKGVNFEVLNDNEYRSYESGFTDHH